MKTLTLKEFADDIVNFNSFIVNGRQCLGSIWTKNYEKEGILVFSDWLYSFVWLVEDWKLRFLKKIIKEHIGDRAKYTVFYENKNILSIENEEAYSPVEIIAYNRSDIGTIPIEEGIKLEQLSEYDVFDDSLSFLDIDRNRAIIGLDIRKFKIDDDDAYTLGKLMRSTQYDPLWNLWGGIYTFCLVVDINDYTYSIRSLDVNTFRLGRFNITEKLHSSSKIKEYVQKMRISYNQIWNRKKGIALMKQLCELIP